MKKKQKILPLGIMFIMALAVFMIPSFGASAQEFTSGDWNYEVNEGYYDGQAVLTGYVGSANNIKIPETIDEKKVGVIAQGCFLSNGYVETIDIPESITDIENYAIKNCSNLKKVYIRGKRTNVSSVFMTGSSNCTIYCFKSLPAYDNLQYNYSCLPLDIYVKLNRSSVTLNRGKKTTLKAKVYNVSGANVTWSVANSKVASVSSSGCVIAKKSGKTTVTARYTKNGAVYKDSCTVYVNKPYISGSTYLYITEKKKLRVYNNGTKKPHWSSSNKKVAVINGSGYVTGKKAGRTTIKANVGGVVVSYKVYVYGPSISSSSKEVTVGCKSYTYVYPSYLYSKKTRWSSSNSRIAKVDKNGTIYGRRVGKCTIYARVVGKKLRCKIAVKKNEYKRPYISKLSDVSIGYIRWELISAKKSGNKVVFKVKFLNNTSSYCSKLSYLKFNCITNGINYGTYEKDGINLYMSSYSVKTVTFKFKTSKAFRKNMDLRAGTINVDSGNFDWI